MRNIEDQVKRLAALTSVMMMAAAEAMAQDKRPARRIWSASRSQAGGY